MPDTTTHADAHTPAQIDETTIPGDTPTNRLHMMQMNITQIADWITRLQKRRATIVEKIVKAKANKNVARTLTVDKQFKRLVQKMERLSESIQADLDTLADDLNKSRALFLEASDGEVIIEKEQVNGTETVANR